MTITKSSISIGECNFCDKELYEGQKTVYDKEGFVSYCDDQCFADHIRKHPREYLEMMFDHGLIERVAERK